MAFAGFSAAERAFLAGQRLGRLATVSPTGVVGNAPVTFFVRSDDTVDIGGSRMGGTKKFRNVEAGSRVAFVVDDLLPGGGWNPRYPGDSRNCRSPVGRGATGQGVLPRGDQDPSRLGAVVRTGQRLRLPAGRPITSRSARRPGPWPQPDTRHLRRRQRTARVAVDPAEHGRRRRTGGRNAAISACHCRAVLDHLLVRAADEVPPHQDFLVQAAARRRMTTRAGDRRRCQRQRTGAGGR